MATIKYMKKKEGLMKDKLSSGWGFKRAENGYVATYDPFGIEGMKNRRQRDRALERANEALREDR